MCFYSVFFRKEWLMHNTPNRRQSYTIFLIYANVFNKKLFFIVFSIFSCVFEKKILPLPTD